jgi:hypothetical protein
LPLLKGGYCLLLFKLLLHLESINVIRARKNWTSSNGACVLTFLKASFCSDNFRASFGTFWLEAPDTSDLFSPSSAGVALACDHSIRENKKKRVKFNDNI